MSKFSNKCDLSDHIMMEKMYDHENCLVGDELECFEIFKKKTGGVIYQNRLITVSEWNQDYVKEHCKRFDFIEHTREVADKRPKSGKRTEKYYTYKYYETEYNSLKELNKHGVYITVEIHFDTLLDIIPYYGNTISFSACDQDKETVYISDDNYALYEYKRSLKDGGSRKYPNYVIQDIAKHIAEVTTKYFTYKLEERTKIIPIAVLTKKLEEDSDYYLSTGNSKIDYMHDIEFVWEDGKVHSHWTSPKMVYENCIKISKQDVEYYLVDAIKNGTVKIKYVEKCEYPNEARDNAK